MPADPQPRRPRADAARNRSQILEVALRAYREEGLDVSMDSIAKRAGVGPGTLYRHFPTRDALLAALLLEEPYSELQRAGAAIRADEPDPVRALDRWIAALAEWMGAYGGLPEPLRVAWMQPTSALGPTCQTLIDTTAEFLETAQHAGKARASLTGRDIFLGAMAIAWAGGASAAGDGTHATLREVMRTGWAKGGDESPS